MVKIKKKYDVFNDSLESFYWIGFLLADGSFVGKRYIAISLSLTDINHLDEFKKFLKTDNTICVKRRASGFTSNIAMATLRIGDKFTVEKLCEKFNIETNKTKNPPWIKPSSITDDQFMSLLVGFIDGDGTIFRKKNYDNFGFRLKNHANWLNNLNIIADNLKRISNIRCKSIAKINKQGYAQLSIDNTKIIKYLKRFTIKHCLPVLTRKWDMINVGVRRFELLENEIRPKIKMLRNAGNTFREIQKYLKMNHNVKLHISTIQYHSRHQYKYA